MIQQKISEQEKALHKPNSEITFSAFISTINEEVSTLVKYFRKHPKQLLEYAQTHIPVQETDIFIESLTNYCSLILLSLEQTALQLPIIYHALILTKHVSYYALLHKGLTLSEFNELKHNLSRLMIEHRLITDTNTTDKQLANILRTEITSTGNYITELLNYFADFSYKTNPTNLFKPRTNKPIPVLDNSYYAPIYYSKNEIFKTPNQMSLKYVLIINPYASQRLPPRSVEYNNNVPDIDHVIYDDHIYHGLYKLHERNWNEPAYELHLFNGSDYHILSRGSVEDMLEYFQNKRIDDIPVSVFMSFNIYPFTDNEYVKLIIEDIYPKLKRSLNTITSISELCSYIDESDNGYKSDVKITGALIKQMLQGYSIRTICPKQYYELLKRELIRKSIYAAYSHRNPDIRATGAYHEIENKLIAMRKQLNAAVNDNSYKFKSQAEIKQKLLEIVMRSDIEEQRKILYKNTIDSVISRVKIPIDPIGMEMVTKYHTSVFG